MARYASHERDRDRDYILSTYGFLVPFKVEGPFVLDLYVPTDVVHQMHLRAGSTALVQGLAGERDDEFYVRGKTGLEKQRPGRQPFTATVRFPNNPGILADFLESARAEKLRFQAIRTIGYRGNQAADVLFEGSFPEDEPHFVYRLNLRRTLDALLRPFNAKVSSQEILRFHRPLTGSILPTRYFLKLPIFSQSFLKIRIRNNNKSYFRAFRDTVTPVRLRFDPTSTTLTVDARFGERFHYLLAFTDKDLQEAPPVTKTILEQLPEEINVDAISAYEWMRFDPLAGSQQVDGPDLLGRIEMLCTASREVDYGEISDRLRGSVEALLNKPVEEMEFQPFPRWLEEAKSARSQKPTLASALDPAAHFFTPAPDDGRYSLIRSIGVGNFGEVFQYCDTHTGELVAGKHFSLGKPMGSSELETFVSRAGDARSRTEHLVRLKGHFFHDDTPVIVTEYLPFTLDDHDGNPRRDPKKLPHRHPADLREFASMAVQLADGLRALHEPADTTDESLGGEVYVHRDIKPANIGGILTPQGVTWKFFDFGLVSAMPPGVPEAETRTLGGTPPYMAPQMWEGKAPKNDIYALGVTLFEVICGWSHPSRSPSGGNLGGWAVPIEVAEYVTRPQSKDEFDQSRWQPTDDFCHLDGEAVDGVAMDVLRELIYAMIRLDANERLGSARELHNRLISWSHGIGVSQPG